MKNAESFELNSYTGKVKCPHCDHENDGWLSDPRGIDSECDDCGKQYHVPDDIQVNIV